MGFAFGLVFAISAGTTMAAEKAPGLYATKVQPLLEQHCVKCHGPEKQKAQLRLDSLKAMLEGGEGGPAVVPGDLESSRLILAVSYEEADLQMPPDGKLEESEIGMLKKWIAAGAPGE